MTALFIANMSKQHHLFLYRIPERDAFIPQEIPVGSQIKLPGDFSPEDIEYIVKQHQPYGLKAVDDLPRNKEFVGLCYSVGKPVQIKSFDEALERNDIALNERAEEKRATAAEAIRVKTQQFAQEAGMSLARTEVETVEDTLGTPSIAVGFESPSEGVEPRRGRRASKES